MSEGRPADLDLDRVRIACREVAASARHVAIDDGRIASYARALLAEEGTPAAHDPEAHFLGHGRETVAFFVTLSAVNFGSGYFPALRKRAGRSGYFTIASSLAGHFRRWGSLSAQDLAGMTLDRCTELFGQDATCSPVRELMALYLRSLHDLGMTLERGYGGDASLLVDAADGRAERLVSLLLEMPLFRDVARHRSREVAFYKRAQLLAWDLSLAFSRQGPGLFRDLEKLTIFADNLVPHVLRLDGILRYPPSLVARIERGDLFPAGSEEEVEIRACAVDACERIVQAMRDAGKPAIPAIVDTLLWNRGQGVPYKAFPRHRTRSAFY